MRSQEQPVTRTSGRQPQQPGGVLSRLLDLFASRLPHRRLRLLQWLIPSIVYASIALLLTVGVHQGWMRASALAAWATFVGVALLVGYVALRSGWSERFAEPSLS